MTPRSWLRKTVIAFPLMKAVLLKERAELRSPCKIQSGQVATAQNGIGVSLSCVLEKEPLDTGYNGPKGYILPFSFTLDFSASLTVT